MYLNFRALLYTSAFDARPITELMFEAQNPETVRRSPNGTYCDTNVPTISRISSSVVIVATVVIVLLLSVLGYRVIRNRRHVLKEGTMFTMLFRVIAFSIIGVLALVLSVAFVSTNDHDGVFDMLLASSRRPNLSMTFHTNKNPSACSRDAGVRESTGMPPLKPQHLTDLLQSFRI
ncbi:hypothetical protein AN958_00472 [Leucoagaricus sp. SymC.cos]|nr:hypothetical protein AN958_00472 [Leucoagaricus sp. SymC.cos]